jgi:hypothetical protein
MHVPGSIDNSGRRSKSITLTRNNIEVAGVVVYFFALAVLFAITIIVMLCRTGSGTNERAANHQPQHVASLSHRN